MTDVHRASLPCPICFGRAAFIRGGRRLPWRYARCQSCEHTFLHPAPSAAQLASYYNGAYKVPIAWYEAAVSDVHRLLSTYLGTDCGVMLEIGCSYGSLLARFRDEGWSVEGVEIDERAASYARSYHKLSVQTGTLETTAANLSHRKFDVIMMNHVLEHVQDPHSFARHIASLLKPGGRVVMRTPNASSAAMKIEQSWWEWSAAPEHVNLYSPDSICRLLKEHGMRCQLLVTRRGDARGVLFESLSYVSRRIRTYGERDIQPSRSPSNPQHYQSLMSRPWFRPLRGAIDAIGAPVDRLLGSMGLGPELLVIAGKTDVT